MALLGVVALAAGGAAAVAAPVADAAPKVTTYPLGLVPSPPSAVAPLAVPEGGATFGDNPVPASVDLTSWAVPVGNQGQIGSCVSWTVGYAISGWFARRQGQAGTPYAPLFLYNQITNGQGGASTGTTFYQNLQLEQTGGIVPLSQFPSGHYNPAVIPSNTQKAAALDYRITSWNTLYYNLSMSAASGQTLIKQALANEKPVALGIKVYQNFYSVSSANPYYSAPSGSFLGRHAVAVLAYDSYGVKIQNSWGTGWGQGGYAWLSWSFLAQHSEEAYVVNGFTAPTIGTPPVISSLSATSGPWSGGTITISGSNLGGAVVSFGTQQSPSVTVDGSGSSLTATVPAAAPSTVNVTVSTPTGGRSNAIAYEYAAATPTITSVSPATGSSAGGTTVTISGTHLRFLAGSAYTVSVGGRAATNVVVAPDGLSLTAVTPAGSLGAADVTVTNAGGTTAASTFTFQWPVTPTLTVTPPKSTTVKPGAKIALVGWLRLPSGGAVAKTPVTLEGRAKGSSDPYTAIRALTTAKNGKVSFSHNPSASIEYRLSTAGDVTSTTVVVTVQPAPVVLAMDVTTGNARGGTIVTLTGMNFQGAKVTVGGKPAGGVTVAPDGESLTFVTPGRSPGNAPVQVITFSGKVRAPVPFAFVR